MQNTEAGEMDKARNFMNAPIVNRRGVGVGCHEKWIMEKTISRLETNQGRNWEEWQQ